MEDYTLGGIIIDLIVTAIIYVGIPLSVAALKKPLKQKTAKKITILTGIFGYVGFVIINYCMATVSGEAFTVPHILAAVFWSWIAYKILGKKYKIAWQCDMSSPERKSKTQICQKCNNTYSINTEKCPICGYANKETEEVK